MSKEKQNIADVKFVIDELNRFISMDRKDFIRHIREHREDAFATLRGPRGGSLFYGKAAYDRFGYIADHIFKPGSAKRKGFDRKDYIRALRNAFEEVFIEKGSSVIQSSVMRFINRAHKIATDEWIHVTHHLPCIVFWDREPDHFSVGPVTFTRTDRFLTQKEEELSKYRDSHFSAFAAGLPNRRPELSDAEVNAESAEFADKYIEKIRSYYLEYEWVASVMIPPAHGSVSQLRAERTVDAALDVLRLFVPTYPARYRRANASNTPFDTRERMTTDSGHLISSIRHSGRGAPAMKGWYDAVTRENSEIWDEFEQAIGMLTEGRKRDELTQRLVDALNWFGQAVVEINPAATIVKYTAALERLTITGHVDKGLEKMVIELVSFLNDDSPYKSAREIKRELGDLYQMRSDLMHGSISPYHNSVPKILRIGWEVTRWSILRAALLFRSLRVSNKANRKDLAIIYERSTSPGTDLGWARRLASIWHAIFKGKGVV